MSKRTILILLIFTLFVSFGFASESFSLPTTKKQQKSAQKQTKQTKSQPAKSAAVKTPSKAPVATAKGNSEEEESGGESTGGASDSICKSYILMDAKSGEILYEQNSHLKLPPASMIKMMTAYVVLRKIEEGLAQLSDVVTTSTFASKVGGSQVYLKEGEQFTLGQMLEAIMVQSANDAAVAVAEHIAGDKATFVQYMNEEAQALGLKDTEIHSPHGLPPAKDQSSDITTAYDLALLGRALITRFPEILELSSRPTAPFRDGTLTMTSSNHLLRNFPGADGIKTGFTVAAGYGVTATAQRNGLRMIAVAMGCENGKKRFAEAGRLLSLGFSQYRTVKLIDQGVPAKTGVPVVGGEKAITTVATSQSLNTTAKTNEAQNIIQREETCKELKAPVAKGTPCGALVFLSNGKELTRVSLVTVEDIPALTTGGKLLRTLRLK